MNEDDFEIVRGEWRPCWGGEGLEYEATALSKKTKLLRRIIARATAHVSLSTLADLNQAYGPTARKEIEDSVANACKQLALKFPAIPAI
jgi:hypothetical protein